MQEQWDRCNYVVLNWILGCVSQDVFLGQVFSKNAKTIWDELEETYSKQDASVIFNMHYKIHSLCQYGALLSEYYHKSIILTTDPIPDVRGAFATLSRDESHRSTQSHYVPKIGNGNTAFLARTNNKVNNNNNNWSGSNNQPIKLNRPNLVCTHCNMNGHIADRCFELIGYPPNFKKNTSPNKGSASNNVVSGNKDKSHTFTDDQYKRLMSLISEKSGSSSIPANIAGTNCVMSFCSSRLYNHNSNIISYKIYIGCIIDFGASQHMTYTIINRFTIVIVSKLNMTVGHPNGTKALVTHIGSLKLTNNIVIHNVLVVPGYQVSLLSVHSLSKDNKFRVVFDEDTCVIQDFVLRTQVGTGNESNRTPSSVLSGKSLYEMIFKCLKKNKDYELELKDLKSLNFFNNDLGEDLSSEPYDDRRDSNSGNSKGTYQLSHGGTENTSNANKDDGGLPNDSIPEAVICEDLESAILEDNSLSKGDNTDYQEFNNQFQNQSPVLNPDR
ncbi:hypothetical protein Tco_0702219 [Tanacetum coccineum]|uniref:Uncharacterized protein n=1 Tax=Tanacetum coccineum TaxID=301880 RepID=A0ABQ4XXB1_9ASTR